MEQARPRRQPGPQQNPLKLLAKVRAVQPVLGNDVLRTRFGGREQVQQVLSQFGEQRDRPMRALFDMGQLGTGVVSCDVSISLTIVPRIGRPVSATAVGQARIVQRRLRHQSARERCVSDSRAASVGKAFYDEAAKFAETPAIRSHVFQPSDLPEPRQHLSRRRDVRHATQA